MRALVLVLLAAACVRKEEPVVAARPLVADAGVPPPRVFDAPAPARTDKAFFDCLELEYFNALHQCNKYRLPLTQRPDDMTDDECHQLWRKGVGPGRGLRPFKGYEEKCLEE